MESYRPTLLARVFRPIDLRDVEYRFPTVDIWNMTRSADFRFLWKSRDEEEIWIAYGAAFESESLTECLDILKTIENLEPLPFKLRVFGRVPFDDGDESMFGKKSFVIPAFIAKWKQNKYESVEIGESFTEPDIPVLRLPAPYKIEKATLEDEEELFPREHWWTAIETIREKIFDLEIRKAVLGRQVILNFDGQLSAAAVFKKLHEQNPNTFLIGCQMKRICFLGASPECLFRVKDGQLSADSLAGTRVCTDGSWELTEKDRKEHAAVSDFLKESFEDFCTDVTADVVPRIKTFATVQHLVTELSGTLRNDVSVEHVLNQLHPTPAVCGSPREKARTIIRKLEPQPRGLFTGAIGWATQNEAEFAVAIRSAILEYQRAVLFAGAGIVAESDADAEYDECTLKMETMRRALPL